MIPVKFRAWDKDEKWMVYDILNAYDGMWSYKNSDEINDHYGYVSSIQCFMDEEEFEIMQYTGLKDKNGVEIYEGDIVKFDARSHYHPEVYAWEYETKGVGVIRFEMGGYVLGGREESHILESLFGMLMNYEEIEMEVIGNIYENPELLKEQNK